jgi:hypothetical protein
MDSIELEVLATTFGSHKMEQMEGGHKEQL